MIDYKKKTLLTKQNLVMEEYGEYINSFRSRILEMNAELQKENDGQESKKKTTESVVLMKQINNLYVKQKILDHKKGKDPDVSVNLRNFSEIMTPDSNNYPTWLSVPTEIKKDMLFNYFAKENKYSDSQIQYLLSKLSDHPLLSKNIIWSGSSISDIARLSLIYNEEKDLFECELEKKKSTSASTGAKRTRGVKKDSTLLKLQHCVSKQMPSVTVYEEPDK